MPKKCGRGLKDVTPLLANEHHSASHEPLVKIPWSEGKDPSHIIDRTIELLQKVIEGFKLLAREEVISGRISLDLMAVDDSKRPLLIKCTCHCGSHFLTECLEVLGAYDATIGNQFAAGKEFRTTKPRLVIVAAAFAPGIHRALKTLVSLPLVVYRLTTSSAADVLPIEQFDFERAEFFPVSLVSSDADKPSVYPPQKTAGKRQLRDLTQLSLDLEGELDDIPPLSHRR